jgi:hypothetical protein
MSKKIKPIPMVVKVAWEKHRYLLKYFGKKIVEWKGNGINLVKKRASISIVFGTTKSKQLWTY